MGKAPTRFALAALAALSPFFLAACSSDFDPTDSLDKLDFFHLNDKKKLPGERKELFPGGVPGATQGIPPDLVKGYQAQQTAEQQQAAEQEQQKAQEQEKPKPKPRVARQTPPKQKPAPTQLKVTPQQAQQPQQQDPVWNNQPPPQQARQQQQQTGTQSPWPAAPQQQPSQWPDAPPPNTFQR